MPNLITFLSINKTQFDQGLDGAVASVKKAGLDLAKKLVNPWTIGTGAVGAFAYKVGSALSDMRTQAHDIKFGAALTNLDPQQFQRFYLAGASAESVAKGIEHVAKAQQAVKTGGTGAKDALENFSQFGVTVRDIQSLSYQDLFVKIAENMHVAQLSGEQLTAGVQLM